VTKAIVGLSTFVLATQALADELLRRGVVGGRRARRIIEEAL
jgi:hypothetical protein